MKKIVSLALAVLLVLSLAACGSKNSGTGDVSDALTLCRNSHQRRTDRNCRWPCHRRLLLW